MNKAPGLVSPKSILPLKSLTSPTFGAYTDLGLSYRGIMLLEVCESLITPSPVSFLLIDARTALVGLTTFRLLHADQHQSERRIAHYDLLRPQLTITTRTGHQAPVISMSTTYERAIT